MKSVAIVGAGAAGLCAARHLSKLENVRAVVHEKTKSIGGTWVYSESMDNEHSSMYENMITNLPKQVMQFPEFPFENSKSTFLHHKDVLQYLQKYSYEYGVCLDVKLNHEVTRIKPIKQTDLSSWIDDVRWEVQVNNIAETKEKKYLFDAIFVCNGHYFEPHKPSMPKLEFFKGIVLHSHKYRKPKIFANQNVLVVGTGASGIDIAIDISKVSKRVFLSHRREPIMSELPQNMFEVSEIDSFDADGTSVFLKCGRKLQNISAVLYCTGYEYKFPFLDESCGIKVSDNHVWPLYKHIVNVYHPSMHFIGIPAQILPFRVFNMQVLYALEILSQRLRLPTEVDMLNDCKLNLDQVFLSGKSKKYAHVMTGRIVQYIDDLAKSGVANIPDNIKDLYFFIMDYRGRNLMNYKKCKIECKSEGEFEIFR